MDNTYMDNTFDFLIGEEGRAVTCCFTGHRPAKLPWGYDESAPGCAALRLMLADAVADAYRDGFRRFLCGMAMGGDIYFGEAVVALRDERPDVTLTAVIPFDGQERGWPASWQKRYFDLSVECDSRVCLHSAYTAGCMMERNRWMVDRSRRLIAAYSGAPGGTKNTVLYAGGQGLDIVRLPLLYM